MPPERCKKVCAGKKGNIMYEQCRDDEGKITSMKRIGVCTDSTQPNTQKDVKIVEIGDTK